MIALNSEQALFTTNGFGAWVTDAVLVELCAPEVDVSLASPRLKPSRGCTPSHPRLWIAVANENRDIKQW